MHVAVAVWHEDDYVLLLLSDKHMLVDMHVDTTPTRCGICMNRALSPLHVGDSTGDSTSKVLE